MCGEPLDLWEPRAISCHVVYGGMTCWGGSRLAGKWPGWWQVYVWGNFGFMEAMGDFLASPNTMMHGSVWMEDLTLLRNNDGTLRAAGNASSGFRV